MNELTVGTRMLLVLTFAVCVAELSILVRFLSADLSPVAVAMVLASFHGGYLLADALGRVSLKVLLYLSGISLAVLGIGESMADRSIVSITIVGVEALVFNSVAQASRRHLKKTGSPSSISKNAAKAAGMAVGGLLGHAAPSCLLLLILAACLVVSAEIHRVSPLPRGSHVDRAQARRDPLLLWGEFFHHAHYFCYVYVFWYLAPSLIGPFTGVWFVVGWVAYFVAERIWRERREDFSSAILAGGHLAVGAALLVMPTLAPIGVLTAWFVTGIGGGTAYMLGNVQPQNGRERYEDAGHVVGCLIAATTAWLVGGSQRHAAEMAVFVAAALAAVAAVAFSSTKRTKSNPSLRKVGT